MHCPSVGSGFRVDGSWLQIGCEGIEVFQGEKENLPKGG